MASFLSRVFGNDNKSAAPTRTLGAPGVAIWGGYVEEREKSAELATSQARAKTFADILSNTSIVAAGVRYYANLVGASTWTFNPTDSDVSGAYAALAESALKDDCATPWPRVIRRAAMYRFYGFSIQEWTAVRRSDGWLGMGDIAPRAQATIEQWDVDEESGVVLGVAQRSPQNQKSIYLPRERLVYIVDDTLSDSPEGFGLFRHLVSPAKRLARYEQLEGMGFETDLRGIPKLRAPLGEMNAEQLAGGIDSAEYDAQLKPLRDFAESHVRNTKLALLLDSATYHNEDLSGSPSTVRLWDAELMQGDSQSFAENAAAIERLNREMARILGVEQLMLGSGEGSFALSQDKTHQFYLLINSALAEIRHVVERDLLDRIWKLNGWPDAMKPTITVESVEYRDVKTVAATLRDMATAGAILDVNDPVIDDVRALMGVSAQEANTEPSIKPALPRPAMQAAAEAIKEGSNNDAG